MWMEFKAKKTGKVIMKERMVRNRRDQDRASSRYPGKEFREAKENEKGQ